MTAHLLTRRRARHPRLSAAAAGGSLAAGAIVLSAAIGVLMARNETFGLAALGAFLFTLVVLKKPSNIAVMTVIATFAVQRLGAGSSGAPGGGSVSYSDALLAAASFVALPAMIGTPEMRRLRGAMVGLLVYLATLLPTIFLNPSLHADLEWFHRLVLVGGSLVVGAWLAREERIGLALRLLTYLAMVISVAAVEATVTTGFLPANPLGLNKNFVGSLFGLIIIVLVIAPNHVALPAPLRTVALVVIALGLLSSQSRGGMVAAAFGILLAFMLDARRQSRRAKIIAIFFAVGFAVFVAYSVNSELNQSAAQRKDNSLGVRFSVESVTQDIWRTSPVYGVGLKYFNTGQFGFYAIPANNDIDNELAESGLFGAVGYVVFQFIVIRVANRRRRDGPLHVAALAVIAGNLLHGMVDVYWSAGVVTLSFLVLGMALAAPKEVETVEPEPTPAGTPSPEPTKRIAPTPARPSALSA